MDSIEITVEHDDDGVHFPVYIGGVFVSSSPSRWASRRTLDGALQLVAETVGINVDSLDVNEVYEMGHEDPTCYLVRAST